jgi:hypothetical protein
MKNRHYDGYVFDYVVYLGIIHYKKLVFLHDKE